MQTFILALSRLVPLSFLVSLTLVGSRYLHDLVLRNNPVWRGGPSPPSASSASSPSSRTPSAPG